MLDCAAILKGFQKRSSTKFKYYLALLNLEEFFEKSQFLNS
jgi:hypothetical protein